MSEFEFMQKSLRKLETTKEQSLGQYADALKHKEYWDTMAKNIAGGLQVLTEQIEELKRDMKTILKSVN